MNLGTVVLFSLKSGASVAHELKFNHSAKKFYLRKENRSNASA
jgi:hypothetical protein